MLINTVIYIYKCFAENYQDTVPAILPFYHIYGGVVMMMRSLLRGAKLVTLPKFDPKSFLPVLIANEVSIKFRSRSTQKLKTEINK